MDWKSYHGYKTMMTFLDEVKYNNKDGLIDLKDIGKTAEGRLLKMIKFGHGKSHVFIDAGGNDPNVSVIISENTDF